MFALLLLLELYYTQQNTYPKLPNDALVLPQLNSSFFVLVTGGNNESIALATAKEFDALGASVIVTTPHLSTYNHSWLDGTNIRVLELELGRIGSGPGTVKGFWDTYYVIAGQQTRVYINSALTIANGNPEDYTDSQLEYYYRMSVIDPLQLEMKIIKNRDQNQPLKIGYVTTWAGISKPPYYQPLYNDKASFFIERLHGHNSALSYPNVEYVATLCVFTNTSAMDKSVNPSAVKGNIAQVKFQATFKFALRA